LASNGEIGAGVGIGTGTATGVGTGTGVGFCGATLIGMILMSSGLGDDGTSDSGDFTSGTGETDLTSGVSTLTTEGAEALSCGLMLNRPHRLDGNGRSIV